MNRIESKDDYRVEYAGFRYVVIDFGDTQNIRPELGQHIAAAKAKHCAAALSLWRAKNGKVITARGNAIRRGHT